MRHGFALFAGIDHDIVRAVAREAESLGYGSFWVNHPGSTDGLAALAVAARETRRLALGIGVIPLHTRGPASISQGVRANALPSDRLLLGVGSPNPGSLARVREGVAALRAQLPGVRVIVAALGPRMCRLAGEIADGVLFNWLTPEYARVSADLVRADATAANRKAPSLFAYVRAAIGPEAHDRLLSEANRYGGVPAYAAHFERMGIKPVETAIAAASADAVGPALRKWEGVVDDVVVRAITGKETIEENLALVRAARPA